MIDVKLHLNELSHCNKDNQNVTRALFEKNLHEKVRFYDFRHDILDLLDDSNEWSSEQAYDVISCYLVSREK